MTLILTSDDLESDIAVNDSLTLTNTTIWFVAALSLIVDVRTDVRTDLQTDIFTGFIRQLLTFLTNMLAKINELFIVVTQSLIIFLVNSFLKRYITKPVTTIPMLMFKIHQLSEWSFTTTTLHYIRLTAFFQDNLGKPAPD